MAQPQHTRNDPHAGSDDYSQPAGPAGHASFYENYIEQRATQLPISDSTGNSTTPAALVYDNGYPIPRFNDYVSYFSTRNVDTSVASRKGMADYSNRGFFTIGKNLGQGDYDLPPNNIADGFYTPQYQTVSSDGTTVRLWKGSVTDAQTNTTVTDVPLTAYGAWSDALQEKTSGSAYTLVRANYDAMADLLIPRAVAYSAGLIDYFFRGRMEITLPSEGVYSIVDHAVVNGIDEGFTKVKLKLRNSTPPILDGQGSHEQAMTDGKLYAVAKYRRNPCYQPDLSGEHTANGAIINGCSASPNPTAYEEVAVSAAIDVQSVNTTDPQPFSFDFTDEPIPLNATDLYLQVVFRGQIGSEADAVAVVTKDISEPTYYDISNSTDYMLDENYAYVINPSPTVINSIGLAFNDSYSFVAQMGALQVATFARVAILVDSVNTEIAATSYDSDGSSRHMTPININQLDEAGQLQARPFNRCANGDVTQYRGINWLNGVIWWESGGSNCSQYSSLMPFSVLDPAPFDRINF